MDAACNWQYQRNDLIADTDSTSDPYSWQCYDSEDNDLGGVYNLDGYCQSFGYSGVNHDAANAYDWYCIQQKRIDFDMTKACQWTYNRTDVEARTVDLSNPYLWECWTT
jgi:hypothetical protein